MNDYTEKRNQIADAMRGIFKLPEGRRLVRFTHGRQGPGAQGGYWIGYQWMRTHANPMTGMVYEVTIALGDSFDAALEKAVAKVRKAAEKRAGGSS